MATNISTEDGYLEVKIGNTYRDRYSVLQKLGRGNFSTVWLCWDEQKSQFVALKIVRSAHYYTRAALREIEFLDCVQRNQSGDPQPHKVVQLLDSFAIPVPSIKTRHICLVFETLGPNLKQTMKHTRMKSLSLTTVKSILRQILEALDYLHTTCKMIHTDVKPENICVDENKDCTLATALCEMAGVKFSSSQKKVDATHVLPVTLADLGCARWVDEHIKGVIQTRPYRSPEVILGNGYRANADVWSAACTAFELATGKLLFPLISRNMNKRFSEDEYHLALITRLLGDIPEGIAFASVHSSGFFNEDGELWHAPPFDSCGLVEKLTRFKRWDGSEAAQFADFLLPMLAIDPDERCSARDCLRHKWLEL